MLAQVRGRSPTRSPARDREGGVDVGADLAMRQRRVAPREGSGPRGALPRSALVLLPVAGFLALAVLAARMPVLTPDVWWHLATGRLVADSGIPHTDPFSYTLAGRTWTAHEWLADVISFGVHATTGLVGLVLLRGLLLAAAFTAAYAVARLQAPVLLALALLVPAAYASQRNWLDRPQLWSFLLTPLLLWILERHRLRPDRLVYALPLLFALWVNLHGGFMLGLTLLLLWILCEAMGRWQERSSGSMRRLALVGLASLLATLANPNGFAGAVYPLHYVGAGLGATLQEEQAGRLDSPYAWVHLGLVLSLWTCFLLRWRRTPPAHIALGVGLGCLSLPRLGTLALPFAAERHAPLFLLLGTPLLAFQLGALVGPAARARMAALQAHGASRWAWSAATAALALLAAVLVAALPRDGSPEARLLPGRYPVAAARWLEANSLPGNMINPYRWGGYLAFALAPRYKVWIDSRGDLYGLERLREAELLQRFPPGSEPAARALLQRYDANVVVWHLLSLDFGALRVHPFADFLLRSDEWRLVFFDRPEARYPDHPAGVSAVFLRQHPRNQELLQRYAPVRLPPLPRPAGARTPPR